MALGNIGRVIAGQALETAKKSAIDALTVPDAPKSAPKAQPEKPAAPPPFESIGSITLGQMQAMQRALTDEQELSVLFHNGSETLRVHEIFVPNPNVFVLAGVDAEQHVTRTVVPADAARLFFKVTKVAAGAKPVRVNVLSPRPKSESA